MKKRQSTSDTVLDFPTEHSEVSTFAIESPRRDAEEDYGHEGDQRDRNMDALLRAFKVYLEKRKVH